MCTCRVILTDIALVSYHLTQAHSVFNIIVCYCLLWAGVSLLGKETSIAHHR